jgi:hypothetical protein
VQLDIQGTEPMLVTQRFNEALNRLPNISELRRSVKNFLVLGAERAVGGELL